MKIHVDGGFNLTVTRRRRRKPSHAAVSTDHERNYHQTEFRLGFQPEPEEARNDPPTHR